MRSGAGLLLCMAIFLCHDAVLAADSIGADDVARLAQDPRWQRLLHINRGATLRHRGVSYVRDAGFFLAPQGADDMVAELAATIAALAPAQAPQRCRFPARYRFIARVLRWQEADPLAHCGDYIAWREAVPADSVVMVFPAAYLNSPSSMFGHTLLRFDRHEQPSDWHAWAVNFGAVVDNADTSMLYVYRGLAGGYPGRFATVPYVEKIQEYAHLENRDMWEYQLTLTAGEISWMLDHLWELRDIDFAYYFLDENCSFRLLELIEVARPELTLLVDYRFAEIPVNTVRTLEQHGLIAARHYRPSKAVELEQLGARLSQAERDLAAALMRRDISENDPLHQLAPARQRLVARAAYMGIRYRHRTEARDAQVARRSMALLRVVNAQGASMPQNKEVAIVAPTEPEVGHPTKMVAFSGGQLEQDGFGEAQFRLTYHDWLDNPAGFLSGAWIEAINVRLRRTESDRFRLWSFDLIDIRSLAPRSAFVKPWSWRVNAGIDRPLVAGRRGATRFVDGGAGAGWKVGEWLPYGYLLARVENNDDIQVFLNGGAGAELGVLRHFPFASVQLSARSLYFSEADYRHLYSAGVQLPISRRHGLRLSVAHEVTREDEQTEWALTWRHYFD